METKPTKTKKTLDLRAHNVDSRDFAVAPIQRRPERFNVHNETEHTEWLDVAATARKPSTFAGTGKVGIYGNGTTTIAAAVPQWGWHEARVLCALPVLCALSVRRPVERRIHATTTSVRCAGIHMLPHESPPFQCSSLRSAMRLLDRQRTSWRCVGVWLSAYCWVYLFWLTSYKWNATRGSHFTNSSDGPFLFWINI